MTAATTEEKPGWLTRLNLGWIHRLLTSSIGQKLIMGATGLLLCGFLVGHLAGNLLLFAGAEKFNAYGNWIHANELYPLAEASLIVLFGAHIYLAFALTLKNRASRRTGYHVKESKIADRTLLIAPSNWMFISGSVVLGFLILHLIDMRFAMRPDVVYDHESQYRTVLAVLSNPISRLLYLVGVIFLGFHLSHGFSSAFRTLGLSHPKYSPAITWLGIIFAVVIGGGFALFPILMPGMQATHISAIPEPHGRAP